jgi:phosphoglycolate phosphatase-like HAD superfamily hydrolase
MVGDSYVDIETAKNAGVQSCGVTYGFRPDTLADPVPTLLCNTMEEFADHVLRTHAAT